MKLIEPKYEIVEQAPGIDGAYKIAEYAGRVCYKSDCNIKEDSAPKFVEMLMKSKHMTPLEHATIYMRTDNLNVANFYSRNPYSHVNVVNEPISAMNNLHDYFPTVEYYITTNLRVIVENGREDDMKRYWCEPTENHEKRVTVLFICDIGVTREYNRHRKASINEESTRCCNYTKERFGSELNIMIPVFLKDRLDDYVSRTFEQYCDIVVNGPISKMTDIDWWMFSNLCAERSYSELINRGWKAQEARTILPLDTRSTLVYTMFIKDWNHFFDLRAYGTTGAPHPSAKELALPLAEEFNYEQPTKEEQL